MGRRTQQRRRKRVEELLALRHDEREFRRRWMARVEAWCKGLAEGKGGAEGRAGGGSDAVDAALSGRATEVKSGAAMAGGAASSSRVARSQASRRVAEVIESVMRELADIGEPAGSPLAVETRERLEAAAGDRDSNEPRA